MWPMRAAGTTQVVERALTRRLLVMPVIDWTRLVVGADEPHTVSSSTLSCLSLEHGRAMGCATVLHEIVPIAGRQGLRVLGGKPSPGPEQSREISMGRAGAAIDPSRRSVHAAAHLADFGLHALEAIHIRVDFAVPFPLPARLRRRFHAQTARNVGFQKQKMSSCHRSISRRDTGWYHVAQDVLAPQSPAST
jgi:hypothetical protein